MGTAIRTNGEGQRSDYHLNLTRSMADVWHASGAWRLRDQIAVTSRPIKRGVAHAGR
jgi:hypothetical protein